MSYQLSLLAYNAAYQEKHLNMVNDQWHPPSTTILLFEVIQPYNFSSALIFSYLYKISLTVHIISSCNQYEVIDCMQKKAKKNSTILRKLKQEILYLQLLSLRKHDLKAVISRFFIKKLIV